MRFQIKCNLELRLAQELRLKIQGDPLELRLAQGLRPNRETPVISQSAVET